MKTDSGGFAQPIWLLLLLLILLSIFTGNNKILQNKENGKAQITANSYIYNHNNSNELISPFVYLGLGLYIHSTRLNLCSLELGRK